MNFKDPIADILWKYVNAEPLTIEEKSTLDLSLSESRFNQKLFDEVTEAEDWIKELKILLNRDSHPTWNKIVHAIDARPEAKVTKIRRLWIRYTAAAAVIVGLIVANVYLIIDSPNTEAAISINNNQNSTEDCLPGYNKAMLTLADGTKKELTNTDNGKLLPQNTIQVTTPRGGQYQAVLPDGSKVWLNSESAINLPTVFAQERKVEITGEAYLEVEKNATKPFFVKTRKTTIQVLGTSFNVNAYADDDIEQTTLIEGSIRVSSEISSDRKNVILKPGQRALIGKTTGIKVNTENISDDIAWQKGYFTFTNTSIQKVMSQLSRWYNVSVVYPEGIPQHNYTGTLSRSYTLSEIVARLQIAGIKTKLSKDKLEVLH